MIIACALLAHTQQSVRNGGDLHQHTSRMLVRNNHKLIPPPLSAILTHLEYILSPTAPFVRTTVTLNTIQALGRHVVDKHFLLKAPCLVSSHDLAGRRLLRHC